MSTENLAPAVSREGTRFTSWTGASRECSCPTGHRTLLSERREARLTHTRPRRTGMHCNYNVAMRNALPLKGVSRCHARPVRKRTGSQLQPQRSVFSGKMLTESRTDSNTPIDDCHHWPPQNRRITQFLFFAGLTRAELIFRGCGYAGPPPCRRR